MARVTVQDCLLQIENHFDLVVLAAERSRQLSAGHKPTTNKEGNKNPVTVLREIAEKQILPDDLRASFIAKLQGKTIIEEEAEESTIDLSEIKDTTFVEGDDEMMSEIEDIDITESK